MTKIFGFFIFGILFFDLCVAVDKNNFKTCDQSSFCRRLRAIKSVENKYALNLDSLQVTDSTIEAILKNNDDNVEFKLSFTAIAGNIFRLLVDEVKPLLPRYRVEHALAGEPQVERLEVLDRNKDTITVRSRDNKAVINASPFKISFFKGDNLVAIVNGRNLFEFEHLRTKSNEIGPEPEGDGEAEHVEPEQDVAAQKPAEDPGAWEENFKSHHDSKVRGPEAVGLDIVFPGALRVYGLPEHADKLALRTTGPGGLDPYRLYNLDVFEYEVESTMALYGAVPVLYAHSPQNTVGAFWHNAAETWVDVTNSKDTNVVSSLVNLVSGNVAESSVDAHFMSESGVIDLFILMGPKPEDVVKQYASLTGTAPLPPYFSLGYHQSRWNYNDQDDVTSVVENFDKNDLPLDVMWLDIEYTDGKKYFTWDPIKFANPEAMIHNLTSTGRKLVVIIDPHIKRESGYFLHDDALANDLYVKNKDNNVYEGWCWPGSSSYLDFLNPVVNEYYKGLYSLDNFKGTTSDVYVWNDMNEPSVFNGPEVTMSKDCLHYGGWEHRHVHNIYGLLHTVATFEGLLQRTPNKRPFILSRAHFAGSQRYVAIWTGDNTAEWPHLAASIPMCLSEALGGISFCGADIGGFFNNPDVELLQRWYQAGIWLPFFRAHAHIDTRRREPFLFNDDVRNRIRNSLRLRYALLPQWYTLFWEHARTGEPIIRPMFYEFPADVNAVDVDDQLLVGKCILAHPVQEAGATSVTVYLPGGPTALWYNINDYQPYHGTGNVNIPVTMDSIPAFYRGGCIIPRKDRPRRASTLSHDDPYTLYVALDDKKTASGTLYVDDTESFEYKNKKYIYIGFKFDGNTLTSRLIDETDFPTEAWIERVVVLGPPTGFKSARLTSKSLGTVNLEVTYDGENRSLVIRKPGVSVREPFKIELL